MFCAAVLIAIPEPEHEHMGLILTRDQFLGVKAHDPAGASVAINTNLHVGIGVKLFRRQIAVDLNTAQ